MEENKENCGVIYILTNPSFPEYVKIGYANNIDERLKQLNRSECIPYAFRVYATYETSKKLQDIQIHKMIDNINPNLRAIDTFDGKKRKKEFYAMTPDDAYMILDTIAKLSNTEDKLHKVEPEGHEIMDEKLAVEIEDSVVYDESSFMAKTSDEIWCLYQKLKEAILSLDGVSVEARKFYMAFRKGKKNVVDIIFQCNNLKIDINMEKGTLEDPQNITIDVSSIGHWGNGDYQVYMNTDSDFDYILSLIKQSYDDKFLGAI